MEPLAILALIVVMGLWIIHSIILNRRLIESKSRYHQFFNDSPVALIVVDKNHQIIEWNQAAEIIFGWDADKALNQDITDFLVPIFDRTHFSTILHKAASEGMSYSKNHNVTKYRDEIFCEWRNRLLDETKGDILCMAQDITASKKTLDELNKRSTALESAGDAIFYTNDKGFIEFANRSFFLLNLGDPDEVYGTHIGSYLFKERLTFSALRSQFDAEKTWRGKVTKPSPEGEKVLSVTITAIYNRTRLISYIGNLHDITEISSHVHQLTHQAHHDPLTGATNRSAMDSRLIQAIHRAERSRTKVALFFIDLNDFKQVNDQYGHETGDKLLSGVAKNLRSGLRNSDTISRFGGDEFVIIIEDIKGQGHVDTVMRTINAAINEPITIKEGVTLKAKASIGVAIYPNDATDPDTLIKAADTSMYVAKRKKNKSLSDQKIATESEPEHAVHSHSH